MLIKDSNLKYTGISRGWKKKGFGKQLAGIYCISKRVEGTSCFYWEQLYKMVRSENKGFDSESNFNKRLLLTFSPEDIGDDKPSQTTKSQIQPQHDLRNLNWELFSVPPAQHHSKIQTFYLGFWRWRWQVYHHQRRKYSAASRPFYGWYHENGCWFYIGYYMYIRQTWLGHENPKDNNASERIFSKISIGSLSIRVVPLFVDTISTVSFSTK